MLGQLISTGSDIPIYVVAVIGFLATMTSPILAARYIARSNRLAAEEATKAATASAEAARIAAETVVSVTKESATATVRATKEVAETLAASTSETVAKLDGIKAVSDGTHILVNAQHTALLGTVATLARVIAHQNPLDKDAEAVASLAEAEYAKSRTAAEALAQTAISQAAADALDTRK